MTMRIIICKLQLRYACGNVAQLSCMQMHSSGPQSRCSCSCPIASLPCCSRAGVQRGASSSNSCSSNGSSVHHVWASTAAGRLPLLGTTPACACHTCHFAAISACDGCMWYWCILELSCMLLCTWQAILSRITAAVVPAQ